MATQAPYGGLRPQPSSQRRHHGRRGPSSSCCSRASTRAFAGSAWPFRLGAGYAAESIKVEAAAMTLAQTALPQQRHRALAELNAQIELAERTCVRCRLDVQDMTTPKLARRASTLL